MRKVLLGLVACVVAAMLSTGAQAQAINLPDGKYASPAAYLAGTWKWERQEPRQTMIMQFGRDGSFFFHNMTIDLQHWGTFSASPDQLTVVLTRTCSNKSTQCWDKKPPETLEFGFAPTRVDMFMSDTERWDRMK